MSTIYDIITVTCFAAIVLAFFQFTDRSPRMMTHFILVGVLFAIANQLGNSGQNVLAGILILAGASYVVFKVRHQEE
jgi:hypothetical protein